MKLLLYLMFKFNFMVHIPGEKNMASSASLSVVSASIGDFELVIPMIRGRTALKVEGPQW